MRLFEITLLIFSLSFFLLYLYSKKRLKLLKLRKLYMDAKNKKIFNDNEYSKKTAFISRIVFIFSVLSNSSFSYIEGIIHKVLFIAGGVDISVFAVILLLGENTILRILLLICMNLLIYKLFSELSIYKFRSDTNKLITKMQNEILQENEIITSAKRSIEKIKKSMVVTEFEMILNDIIKNAKYLEEKHYKRYFEKTRSYELSLLIIFLSTSVLSGNKETIKKNLTEVEKYCNRTLEDHKDYLFSKIPYLAIIMLLPLFLVWMDSFSTQIMFEETIVMEPKEYIYLFSGLTSYLFLSF